MLYCIIYCSILKKINKYNSFSLNVYSKAIVKRKAIVYVLKI